MAQSTMERWQLRPGIRLHGRCWDDGCVLYDDVSGMTVYVDALAHALIQALSHGPRSRGQLIACLAEHDGLEPQAIDPRGVEQRLHDLQAIDFVERLPR